MTVINVYCDETRHTSDPQDKYAVIGALACPREAKREIVHRIHSLQAKFNAHGEAGWKRISPNKAEFYDALLKLFIEDNRLSFRCIVINRNRLDHDRFNDGDSELGFYKLYYQMLVHWLKPSNEYRLYLDWQQNASSSRFSDLKTILTRKLTGRAHVLSLEPVWSDNQPMVQLVDLLVGAVGYAWNGRDTLDGASETKKRFIQYLAHQLGRARLNASTALTEDKFNIFNWQGRG